MSSTDFKVGNKVYALTHNNEVTEYTVTKVGTKYITVAQIDTERKLNYDERKFFKEDLLEVKGWGSPMRLYRSKQELLDTLEKVKILMFLHKFFSSWDSNFSISRKKLSLNTLRKIKSLIEEESELCRLE